METTVDKNTEFESVRRRKLMLQLHTLYETLPEVINKLGGVDKAEAIKLREKVTRSASNPQ
jgi:ElaB/YqjD/DUF883 family membrane-anchored ribosome-binding protein